MFFLSLVMLLTIIASHYLIMRSAEDVILARQQFTARKVLDAVMGDIQNHYHEIVSYKLDALVRKREQLKAGVNLALAHLESLQELQEQGELEEARARELGAQWLRRTTYGEGEDFLAFDGSLRGVVHPDPQWEGRSWEGYENIKGRDALKAMRKSVQEPGDDFTVMQWNQPCAGPSSRWLAYFAAFAPWDWVVGSAQCLGNIEEELAAKERTFEGYLRESLGESLAEAEGLLAILDEKGRVRAFSMPQQSGLEWLGPEDLQPCLEVMPQQEASGAAAQETQAVSLPGPQGKVDLLLFRRHHEALDWNVCYIISREALMAPVNELAWRLGQIIAAIFLCSIAVIFVIVHRFTRPIAALSAHARSLPESDFRMQPEVSDSLREIAAKSKDECGELADAYLSMQACLDRRLEELHSALNQKENYARRLQTLNEQLEQRVQERTGELNQAVMQLQEEIAEHETTFKALHESNQQLSGIFEHAPLLLYLKDLQGRFMLVNKTFGDYFGLESSEIVGRASLPGLPSEAGRRLGQGGDVLASLRPRMFEEYLELEDRLVTLLTTSFPLFSQQGEVFAVCCISQDVSQLRLLQAEAVQASQLASLGKLAASIAHEVNNPISGIISLAELLQDMHEASPDRDKIINSIIKESNRIAGIVQSLLSYSRKSDEVMNPVDLRSMLEDIVPLLRLQLMKQVVRFEVDIPDDTPLVCGKEQELKQIFLNLIGNAIDAMEDNAPEQERVLRIEVRHPAEGKASMLRCSFVDTGPGVPSDKLPHIFKPFYTTKPSSKGTGLGLSIARQIVEAHGGTISLSSNQGRGARVDVDLPLWTDGLP